MDGKENPDLFSHLSSNDGSLPLDFDRNTGVAGQSKGETERKTGVSESSSIKFHPKVEMGESQRRPTHHVPPPYKNSVQETVPLEHKNNVEAKGNLSVHDKPTENTEVEPIKNQDEVKPADVTVEVVKKTVSASIAALADSGVPVSSKATTVPQAVPASIPIVETAVSQVAPQIEKSPEAESTPKRVRQPKTPHAKNSELTEKQAEPAIQVKPVTKIPVPDTKQKEVKTPDIQKHSVPVSVKKEVTSTASPVPSDQKVTPEQKESKAESHKPVKKTSMTEKFSTDHVTAGQLLQEGRVKAGLSIDQVSISTKIKKTFIDCLERDDFENLPASVYVNAYARSLCSLYNIDKKVIFSLLNKVKGKNLAYTVPEEVIHQLEKGKQVNIVQENKVKRMLFVGFAACLILTACISITYYFIHAGVKTSSSGATVKPAINLELPAQTDKAVGISAKTIEEEMEKKLMPPHIFTMTALPLAER
jgi:hypothetical protein